MRRDFYVYCLFRMDTGEPFYVGKGQRDRMESHTKRARKNDKSHRKNIIRKMVETGHAVRSEKLAQDLTEEAAFVLERTYIAVIGRYPNGPLVNKTDGGEGVSGYRFDPVVVERVAAMKRGKPSPRTGYTNSPETRAKLSAALKGRVSPNKGRKMSDQQKEKLRLAHLGKKHTPEHRAAISRGNLGKHVVSDSAKAHLRNINTGKKHSAETREKISMATKGRVAPNKGKSASAATRAKISVAKRGQKQSPESVAKRIASRLKNAAEKQKLKQLAALSTNLTEAVH